MVLTLLTSGSHIYDVYVTGTSVLNAEQQVLSFTQGDSIRHAKLAGNKKYSVATYRGAEAGGILGVNTPTFLALHPPLFRVPKKWELGRGKI